MLQKVYYNIDNILKKYKSVQILPKKIYNLNLKENKYLDIRIVKKFIDFKYGYIYKFENFEIEFWNNRDNIKLAIKMINFTKMIIYLLQNLKFLIKSDISNLIINIKLVNYNLPKKYIINSGKLSSYNVNSGVTSIYNNKIDCIIYRKEEMCKVLIHELIHCLCDSNNIKLNIEKLCVLNMIDINECYTETLASIINLIIYTIYEGFALRNRDFSSKNLGKNNLIKNFEIERKFIELQSKKILIINNDCKHKQYEKTNITAYYILKSLMFNNINDFLKLILKNKNLNNLILHKLDIYLEKLDKNIIFKDNNLKMTILDVINFL